MASPQAFEKLAAELMVARINDTSDRTTAAYIPVSEANVAGTWFDMRDFSEAIVIVDLTDRTDNIESFSIYASPDSDNGSSNAVEIVAHAGTTGADAASDRVVLSVSASQIAQEGADNSLDLRYISAKVKLGNSSDRCGVTIIAKAKRPHLNLTTDYSA